MFIRVLKSLWRAGAYLSSVTARSNWIVDQVDVRGWAHSLGAENGDNMRGWHHHMTLCILAHFFLVRQQQRLKKTLLV